MNRLLRPQNGFTLIELLTVIAIIAILAALTLQVSGFVQKKAASSRAQTEIKGLEAACENYKSDNGIYPRDPTANTATDKLDAQKNGDPVSKDATLYKNASLVLYRALSGDMDLNGKVEVADGSKGIDGSAASPVPATPTAPKTYFEFKNTMLGGTKDANKNITAVTFVSDPWGNSYGYSTAYQYDVEKQVASPSHGYNPTFDLWSTTGNVTAPNPAQAAGDVTEKWIKNW